MGSADVGGWYINRRGSGDAEDVEKGILIRAGGRDRGPLRAVIKLPCAVGSVTGRSGLGLNFSAISASPLPLRLICRKRSAPAKPTHPRSSPTSRFSVAIALTGTKPMTLTAPIIPTIARRLKRPRQFKRILTDARSRCVFCTNASPNSLGKETTGESLAAKLQADALPAWRWWSN